jgi:two-component system, sensor histidine kinase and response regulator
MPETIKFLLVDDVNENLVALEALLRRDGLEILTARSGTEALELVLLHDFALAFIDVQMPEMSGFELAELMRGSERSRHVPIIFVTAGGWEPHRIFKGYESGAVDFLFKPIEANILRHKADVFFELYRQRQLLSTQIAEREQLIREVQETLRLNEMFAAALGHDLRSPLSAIMTGAALLISRGDDKTMAIGNRILSSGSRMARMIEQLLDLSRARLGGGIPVTPGQMQLKDVAEKVVAEHQAASPGRELVLETSGALEGSWDEPRLAQVLSNLIGNALEHGASDRPITVRADGTSPREVILTVNNMGQIPEQELPHLFEPFRSGRQAGRRSEGLGLGLYIVDQLVRAHEGTVRVTSNERDGTTFEVRLPRAASETRAVVF